MRNLKTIMLDKGYQITDTKHPLLDLISKIPEYEAGAFKVEDDFYPIYVVKSRKSETVMLISLYKGMYQLSSIFGYRGRLKYPDVWKNIFREFKFTEKSPNKMSDSITDIKKVKRFLDNWDRHLSAKIQNYNFAAQELDKRNLDIESQISEFIKSLPEKKVTVYDNTTYVDTKLFEVIIYHFYEYGNMSIKTVFKGGLNDISDIHNKI